MNAHSLFQLMVTQTLQVTVLAGIVLALTKIFAKDRPHLAHALWALVLLKCLTPPIVASPTSVFSWLSSGYSAAAYKAQEPTENEKSPSSIQQIEALAPIIVRISQHSNASDRFEAKSESIGEIYNSKLSGSSMLAFALYAWIAIAACVFAVSAMRLWIFLRRVKKATLPTPRNLNRLVASVSKRVGLRRKVRIRTVDSAIGPAVVGLIWPTILLPKLIIEGKSNAELEPLLAHELIHIRRGDLLWAMLQGLSVSLWWFNPLVWIAERFLTREAERSCDEETIAGLGCSPAVYARSLLDVMERKHQLRAAPSLPGVRPVDVTAKRLERIMRLGHGCYRQRPWWVVIIWLIGCALALPGAAWVVAQEKLEREPRFFKEGSSSPDGFSQPTTLPHAPAVAEDKRIEDKSFQIADVLERLCKERNLAKAQAEQELIQILQPVDAIKVNDFEDCISSEVKNLESTMLSLEECISIATKNVRKSTRGISISIVGEQIRIRATAEQLKQIERNIARFRQHGFKSIVTEIEIYEIPRMMAPNVLAMLTGKLVSINEKDMGEVNSDLGLSGSLTLSTHMRAGILESAEIAKIKEWLDEDDNINVVQTSRPRIVSFSGQLAFVEMGTTREFTVAHEAVKTEDGKLKSAPVIKRVFDGYRYEIRAALTEAADNDDAQPIQLSAMYQETELLKVDKSRQKLGDQELEIEIPKVRDSFVETGAELGSDQTLVVIHTRENKTCVILTCCRLLVAAPPLPQADLANMAKPAYVTVSDELQSDLEITLLKYKLQQLGIKDFRIDDDGRLRVNVNEDWKAVVEACQEFRSKRNSAEGATTQPNLAEQKFKDGDTTYSPIQISGPVVQGKWIQMSVPILRSVPYVNRLFKNTEFCTRDKVQWAPSDDEIMQVIERQRSSEGLPSKALGADRLRITTKQIREFSDPIRFVPLLGEAVLHHAHYKCLLHDVKTDELKGIEYIDYRQFWLAEKAEN